MAKKSKAKTAGVAYPCTFGPVGNRKKGSRIGLTILLDKISVVDAWELLANAQLDVTLSCDPNDKNDTKGQQVADYGESKIPAQHFTGDVLRFNVDDRKIGFSLLAPTGVLIDQLAAFSFRNGTFQAERKGDSKTEAEPGD